jgi:hypothetical protein
VHFNSGDKGGYYDAGLRSLLAPAAGRAGGAAGDGHQGRGERGNFVLVDFNWHRDHPNALHLGGDGFLALRSAGLAALGGALLLALWLASVARRRSRTRGRAGEPDRPSTAPSPLALLAPAACFAAPLLPLCGVALSLVDACAPRLLWTHTVAERGGFASAAQMAAVVEGRGEPLGGGEAGEGTERLSAGRGRLLLLLLAAERAVYKGMLVLHCAAAGYGAARAWADRGRVCGLVAGMMGDGEKPNRKVSAAEE